MGTPKDEIMESTLVRRDQFNITPQGIIHKPTGAAFTPYPDAPYAGITRMGQLSNKHPNGIGFRADDVQRMMRELWIEYVIGNPKLFKTAELGCGDPGAADLAQPANKLTLEPVARNGTVKEQNAKRDHRLTEDRD